MTERVAVLLPGSGSAHTSPRIPLHSLSQTSNASTNNSNNSNTPPTATTTLATTSGTPSERKLQRVIPARRTSITSSTKSRRASISRTAPTMATTLAPVPSSAAPTSGSAPPGSSPTTTTSTLAKRATKKSFTSPNPLPVKARKSPNSATQALKKGGTLHQRHPSTDKLLHSGPPSNNTSPPPEQEPEPEPESESQRADDVDALSPIVAVLSPNSPSPSPLLDDTSHGSSDGFHLMSSPNTRELHSPLHLNTTDGIIQARATHPLTPEMAQLTHSSSLEGAMLFSSHAHTSSLSTLPPGLHMTSPVSTISSASGSMSTPTQTIASPTHQQPHPFQRDPLDPLAISGDSDLGSSPPLLTRPISPSHMSAPTLPQPLTPKTAEIARLRHLLTINANASAVASAGASAGTGTGAVGSAISSKPVSPIPISLTLPTTLPLDTTIAHHSYHPTDSPTSTQDPLEWNTLAPTSNTTSPTNAVGVSASTATASVTSPSIGGRKRGNSVDRKDRNSSISTTGKESTNTEDSKTEFGDITIHIDPKSNPSDESRPIKGPEKWHLKEWSAQGGKHRHESVLTIEKLKLRNRLMENGILKFNANPKEGIRYLVQQELIEDSPDGIANFLLTSPGLTKNQIGEYLGDGDAHNISVMFAYVNRLDFSGKPFDEAFRYFLAGFRLPGEAQKIDRMMEKFAERYCRDNPVVFRDQDAAYILAYSLIMLNTDAHSPKVKHKMSKKAFIRNCRDLQNQGLTREYLGQCYDNIVQNEIQVTYDYLEQLYSRVQVNDLTAVKLYKRRRASAVREKGKDGDGSRDDSKIGSSIKEELKEAVTASKEIDDDVGDNSFFDLRRVAHLGRLSDGTVFTKYGRHGHPHPRRVWLSEDTRQIFWQDIEGKKKVKTIQTSNIIDVTIGRDMTEVLAKNHVPSTRDPLCFSIITPDRSLDLEGDSVKDVHLWVNYITQVAEHNKQAAWQQQIAQFRLYKEQNTIGNIKKWREYILPNWYTDDVKIKQKIRKAWKQGIPSCIRNQVWALAIGNALAISPELFESFVRLARLNHEALLAGKNGFIGFEASLEQLNRDLPITFPELTFFHHLSNQPHLHAQSMREILHAYMLYRPDIGYMSGMSHIAAMLLLYHDIFHSFVCFANLMHSHYFLAYCRMDMSQIEWRFAFLNRMIRQHLPNLYHHFTQLRLPLSQFVIDWALALYAKTLPLDITTRIWDLYLLDGEIVVIQVALAILKYFAPQLCRSTYDECIFLLTNLDTDINEIEFWKVVEECAILVDVSMFQALLQKHSPQIATANHPHRMTIIKHK